ncbi:MAG: hypothetical protein AAGF26_02745 [Cyanobacteria bacterium P01_G01_bin.49]
MSEPPIPGVTITFLYYFSMTTLIAIFVISQGMGVSLESQFPYQIGILLGLIAGLIGAYVNRSVTLTLTAKNRKTFLPNLEKTLTELGFSQRSQAEDYTIYSKAGLSSLFSGKILLKVEKKSVTLVGRSRNIKSLGQILG